MVDRRNACIPKLQLNFLDGIALPVYDMLAQLVGGETRDVYQGMQVETASSGY